MDPLDQRVHLFACVVYGERSAGRRRDAETGHDRLRTVMAGPNRDPFGVEYLTDVMRVNAIYRKAQNAGSFPRSAHHPHTRDL